ncbi:MAG: phosphoglycerate kinase, partial [Rickettsiales bacterium]|nr:phosphoglycerate kinase [Rickettsiales bacterium]
RTIKDLLTENIKGKKVLIRADLNVPMKQGKVSDCTRINAVIPTILALRKAGAKILLISHFGRPEGKFDSSYSLSPIVDEVSKQISQIAGENIEVKFAGDCRGIIAEHASEALNNGDVLLLENLRFHAEEEKNDKNFSKELANLAEYFVNDAFSCSHRSHASITGVTEFLPSYAGLCLEKEVTYISEALESPEKPLTAIVGGSKISTKIDILTSLIEKADNLIIGGGMANTFLYAKNIKIGKSLCEKNLKDKALEILAFAEKKNCKIHLPIDFTTAKEFKQFAECEVKSKDIAEDDIILDAGVKSIFNWHQIIANSKTLIWNGPLGAFETSPFENSSVTLAKLVSLLTRENGLKSIAGGGDTVALLATAGVVNNFTYVSTAGGAFLEWLEGKGLPGISALTKNAKKQKVA